jgi:OOP family OmpA-OmpF porin
LGIKLSGIVLNDPSLKLRIEGHTDSTGTAEFNQTLSATSRRRGPRLSGWPGLEMDSIVTQGFGPTAPIGDHKTAESPCRGHLAK